MRKNPPWLQQTFILYPLFFTLKYCLFQSSNTWQWFLHSDSFLHHIPPLVSSSSFFPSFLSSDRILFSILPSLSWLSHCFFNLFLCSPLVPHFFLLSFCFFNLNLHFIFFLWLLFSHLANPILLHQLLNSTHLYHPPFLWWFFFHLKLACANQDEAVWVENRVHMGTCINTHARTQI